MAGTVPKLGGSQFFPYAYVVLFYQISDEQSLMRFASFLADSLHHSSIKVYLSAVRSLHIDNGLPDPLINCLQLQRLLRGIKRVQGSSTSKRLPITVDLLKAIQRSLDLNSWDHVMLWAACCLGFFGFLRAGEFTTNSTFDPSIHLTVGDVQADSLVDPTCFRVHIKCSKTDPFRVGCDIYVGRGIGLICPVVALGNFFGTAWPISRTPVLLCGWPSFNSAAVIIHGAGYFTLCRLYRLLLGPQLPDWGSYHSCYTGNP